MDSVVWSFYYIVYVAFWPQDDDVTSLVVNFVRINRDNAGDWLELLSTETMFTQVLYVVPYTAVGFFVSSPPPSSSFNFCVVVMTYRYHTHLAVTVSYELVQVWYQYHTRSRWMMMRTLILCQKIPAGTVCTVPPSSSPRLSPLLSYVFTATTIRLWYGTYSIVCTLSGIWYSYCSNNRCGGIIKHQTSNIKHQTDR